MLKNLRDLCVFTLSLCVKSNLKHRVHKAEDTENTKLETDIKRYSKESPRPLCLCVEKISYYLSSRQNHKVSSISPQHLFHIRASLITFWDHTVQAQRLLLLNVLSIE